MELELTKIDSSNLGHFRFKRLDDKYLLTNELGDFVFLSTDNFKGLIENRLDKKSETYSGLADKNFIFSSSNKTDFIERYRFKNYFVWQGPTLHIIVTTLRCNYKCIYCQASAHSAKDSGYDLNIPTAKRIIDNIFLSPSKKIMIELQGGEPLLNWEVVKFICNYTFEKNKDFNKDASISIVSNLSLLTEDKLKFLLEKNVTLCTSLDGPKSLHDKNRNSAVKTSSYAITINKIKMIHKKTQNPYYLNALLTLSKFGLSYPKQIIDEYIKWNFSEIHLRPLSNLGLSKLNKEKIGYTADDFIKFYKRALEYLIKLNISGKTCMSERTARIFLSKILLNNDPNFLDLRSPCGSGIGQVLYNYDGKVYCCDEARMLGEDVFLIGDINQDNYKDIMKSPVLSANCFASCLESSYCDYCVYKPYCGVCPVINYAESGNLFTQLANSRLCKINKAILDYLFDKIEQLKYKNVFMKWLKLS